MTPEQALAIIDQAASLAPLSRADHIRVQQAVEVLRTLIRQQAAAEELTKPVA